jgi:hypothetical protein
MNTQIKTEDRKKWQTIEYVGLVTLLGMIVAIGLFNKQFSGVFDAMFTRSYKMFEFYLFGGSKLGATIVVSVMTGRILERLGFTDALMRIFLPIMKYLKINASVVVGVIYNILGDVNAAGKIAGPVVMKAGATKDEQKIAIATLCQAPCSFSIVVLGLMALTAAEINPAPVFIIGILLPIIIIPAILRLFWRDTKAVEIADLPRFTPDTGVIDLIFGSAREGVNVVLLFILPAGCAVFAIIGFLEYFKIWPLIVSSLGGVLSVVGIDPATGIDTVFTAGTLAMKNLGTSLAGPIAAADGTMPAPTALFTLFNDPSTVALAKKMVVGSFVLANSSWPIQVPLGQIPAVWGPSLSISTGEIIWSAIIGCVIRLIYAILCAQLFGLFL